MLLSQRRDQSLVLTAGMFALSAIENNFLYFRMPHPTCLSLMSDPAIGIDPVFRERRVHASCTTPTSTQAYARI